MPGTERNAIQVLARPRPFAAERCDIAVPAGLTLAEIVGVAIPDPAWHDHAVVLIGDERIERHAWAGFRPPPGAFVAVHIVPRGQNGWRIAGMIGIAVLAITASALTYGALTGPAIGMSSVWAGAIAGSIGAAVSIGGTFALNALVPPPIPAVSKDYGRDKPAWLIAGARNRADPWGKVPFLLGRFRLTPPYAAIPYREIVGGDVYWRAIFALSHGPVAIEELRIGETLLANFSGVETELRRGYWSMLDQGAWNPQAAAFPANPAFGETWTASVAGSVGGVTYKAGETITYNGLYPASDGRGWDRDQGKPFRLYPKDVYEEGFAVEVETSVVRTTQANANEIGVELTFPRGLAHIENDPPGKKSDKTVQIRIRQSPAGANTWATVATKIVTARQLTPLFIGHRWKPADFGTPDAQKQYDVEVTNLSGSFDEERNFGRFQLIAIRTVTAANPVPVGGVAMMAVRILASGQLQGVLDEFRVIARTIALDYDAAIGGWVWRPTSQPAALVRQVLQHPSRLKPAASDRIDLAHLAQWDDLCRAKGWVYNGVAEAKGSLWETLVNLCRVGRAMPTLRDLILSVVVDEPKTVPIRLFTPRNSWAYEGELDHGPMPHGYRIGYIDAEREWRADEVVVYADGYDAANATRVERVEWPGITSRAQAWKEGRYHLTQRRLRREVHRITIDFEHLACERGDLVALQHDVIAVGLGTARITACGDDGEAAVSVTIDTPMTMEDGKDYGLRARRIVAGAQVTTLYQVATDPGQQAILAFVDPPALEDAPSVGDLVAFGEYDRETLRVLIRDIEPRDEMTARLTLIAEAAGVHTASQGTIPPYDPKITVATAIPAPVVAEVRSDTRVMLLTASRTLVERVVFTLAPIGIAGTAMHVLYRPSGTSAPWAEAAVQEETPTSVAIVGLTSGETYDFRLQRTRPGYLASPAANVSNHYVIGRTAAPAA
ncbi:MAG TPA: host specificity factor TipJ family phage tail protein, partial [Rhodospirillales bacterium]|nr:host specificity factor TipJ family phage tail protein [Rhodospirillales bacterium]